LNHLSCLCLEEIQTDASDYQLIGVFCARAADCSGRSS
jgi:hypothetical protein